MYVEPHALKAFLSQEFFSCFAVPSFIATVIVLSGFPENILIRLFDPLLLEQCEKGHPLTDLVPDHKVSQMFIELAENLLKRLKLEQLANTN